MASGSGADGSTAGIGAQRGARDARRSGHPVDLLIRDLILTPRQATPDAVAQIAERMAAAPFDARIVPAPTSLRGLTYGSRTVQVHDESLFLHLVKRVLEERQWTIGTSAAEYIDDLRRAVLHSEARLILYAGRSGPIAATVSDTAAAVPERRRGAQTLPHLIVVYSADRGVIITGYQFSGLSTVRIPAEALWLR